MKRLIILLTSGLYLLLSCNKIVIDPLPKVETLPATILDATHVTLHGNVISEGETAVTTRGFCWALTPNPTVDQNFSQNEFGPGEFTEDIEVIPDTTYYYRAYATNNQGTSYGNQVLFKTQAELPIVTTETVSKIAAQNAISGGEVMSDGGSAVTERGVCWSLSENPTISDYKTSDGSGVGKFSSNLTGLNGNTTYYVRAYATNRKGTSYGGNEVFTTIEGGHFTDTRDDKIYNYIRIGTQIWTTENLTYLPAVSPPNTLSDIEIHYYVYGYSGTSVTEAKGTSAFTQYGVLYNWEAAKSACPSGWHLPTDEEWKVLERYLGMSESDVSDEGVRRRDSGSVGKKLKSTSGWIDDGNGDNSSWFTALPARYNHSGYFNPGYAAFFWSATEIGSENAYYRHLRTGSEGVERFRIGRDCGNSVRCIKDE